MEELMKKQQEIMQASLKNLKAKNYETQIEMYHSKASLMQPSR